MDRYIYIGIIAAIILSFMAVSVKAEPEITTIHITVEDNKTHNNIPNASIYIDGEFVGKTSIYGDIVILTSVGTHDITVKANGYEAKKVVIDVGEQDSSYTIQIKAVQTSDSAYTETANVILGTIIGILLIITVITFYVIYRKRGEYKW